MKYSLCILTILGLLGGAGTAAAQDAEVISGQDLVAQAADLIAKQPGLEARLRHRVDLFGQQFVGAGTYLQSRGRPETLIRLELKVQVADQLNSLQHVCDGRFLWIRRDHADRPSLARIDLRRVREAMAGVDEGTTPVSITSFAASGLPKLLRGLEQNFVFDAPRPQTIGKFPVWELRGVWRPVPNGSSSSPANPSASAVPVTPIVNLPPVAATPNWSHVPDEVILVLGRDEMIPLFPYRIDFRRRAAESEPGAGQGRSRTTRSMLVLEFFEVRRRPDLEPRHFSFQVGDQAVEDRTDTYLRSLGLAKAR